MEGVTGVSTDSNLGRDIKMGKNEVGILFGMSWFRLLCLIVAFVCVCVYMLLLFMYFLVYVSRHYQ